MEYLRFNSDDRENREILQDYDWAFNTCLTCKEKGHCATFQMHVYPEDEGHEDKRRLVACEKCYSKQIEKLFKQPEPDPDQVCRGCRQIIQQNGCCGC